MRLIIRDDKDTASAYLAEYIIGRIKSFDPSPEKPFVLGLPTGSSPEGIYKHLVRRHKNGEISFRNVVTFNMYFKSIEAVSKTQGFTQILPPTSHTTKKRDSIISALDSPSPRSPRSASFLLPPPVPTATGANVGDKEGIERAVTPELVPDRMADRLEEGSVEGKGLGGLILGELPVQRMGERVS